MITREEAVKWLRNHPEETGDGFYMASAIMDLHDEIATILANAQRITAQYAAERDNLNASLRLAEASVRLLRADLAGCEKVRDTALVEADDAAHGEARMKDERDAARLELRRLRAAEAPGTDDEAFEGTGWVRNVNTPRRWTDEWVSGNIVVLRYAGRWYVKNIADYRAPGPPDGSGVASYVLALDAMRAAVPGSV